MPRSVAIVFDPDYSMQLERTSFHTPVWMIDTPANRSAAEHAWHEALEWPHISVTLFRPLDWAPLLQQIAMQEKFEVVEAIGTTLTEDARTALVESGFARIEQRPDGFRARR